MITKEYSKNIIYNHNNKKFITKNNLNILGSFSSVKKSGNFYYCTRDPLGTKKIFYGLNNNKLKFSTNFIDLLRICEHETVRSVPKAHFTKISNKGKIICSKEIYRNEKNINYKLGNKLIGYIGQVKKLEKSNTCIVCLSGGLDSTIIAYYLKKKFKNVIAVTAYCQDNINATQNDLIAAEKISKILNILHLPVPIKINAVKNNLKKILYSTQDWRDYNVHCGAINFFIAKYLAAINLNKYPVFTGDFMNEFTADYESEKINNKYFYKINVKDKRLKQRFLINSLDSSAREIGVFNYFKIPLYQPYSILENYYKSISNKVFLNKTFKYNCNGKLIPNKILDSVLKKKTRAQVGDSGGGMIKYFEKLKLDQITIEKKFDQYFKTKKKWREEFISLGSYKT